MSLQSVDLTQLKQALNPNRTCRERAGDFVAAFIWNDVQPGYEFFSHIYDRLQEGTPRNSDTRVLMGLYAYAASARNRIDSLAKSCAMYCIWWNDTPEGDFLRRIFDDLTSFPAVDLEASLPNLLHDLSRNNNPILRGWSAEIRREFGSIPAQAPSSEVAVTDLPYCCAAQYISKWGCGDPDGYNTDMGVEEVGNLFDSGFFNRLKPVQITVLQKYQLEEGLDDLLKSKGWVCLADEVRNNKGVPTLSIWAYFNHNEEYVDDEDYDLDEEY
jgi:hypothetical protein